jgi:tRNA A37 N6-isopentenylltransferase MiaA
MIRTRQLAKKQRTWFRHQMNVRWIEIAGREDVAETAARIIKQWEDDGPIRIAE